MRTLLARQLDIAWSFAGECVIGRVSREAAVWEPSPNVATVHETNEGWVTDWPDEESVPLPDATVGWLLWHIEWWWTDAARVCTGHAGLLPSEHRWSGSTDGLRAAKREWDAILHTTKNLAEINQLLVRRANR